MAAMRVPAVTSRESNRHGRFLEGNDGFTACPRRGPFSAVRLK